MSEQLAHVRANPIPMFVRPGLAPLGSNSLLARLPSEDFELLAPHLTKAAYGEGSVLQEAGEPAGHAHFLESGLVSLMALTPEGHAIGTCAIGRDGAVGLTTGLHASEAATRAVVQIPASVRRIAIGPLREAADKSQPIRDMILHHTDWLLQETSKTVACNAVHHVCGRMVSWLLRAQQCTEENAVPLTQQCFAGLLGVQRTTITLISRRLQNDGLIKVRRGRIYIKDLAGLQRQACSCHSSEI